MFERLTDKSRRVLVRIVGDYLGPPPSARPNGGGPHLLPVRPDGEHKGAVPGKNGPTGP
jgi:hypothetical protein